MKQDKFKTVVEAFPKQDYLDDLPLNKRERKLFNKYVFSKDKSVKKSEEILSDKMDEEISGRFQKNEWLSSFFDESPKNETEEGSLRRSLGKLKQFYKEELDKKNVLSDICLTGEVSESYVKCVFMEEKIKVFLEQKKKIN